MPNRDSSTTQRQREAFERAARKLAPDATEEQFNETLRQVLHARARPELGQASPDNSSGGGGRDVSRCDHV